MVAFVLLIVGGLNWGFVGLLNMNLVEMILPDMPMLQTWVYILVGASAVYIAATHMGDCKMCSKKKK